MNRSSLTVSIAVAILSITGTALAVPEATAGAAAALPSRVVRFDDLNLGQPRSVAILYARSGSAAASCPRPGGPVSPPPSTGR
jgi:UrcA family protein